jgi:hypothetical protein
MKKHKYPIKVEVTCETVKTRFSLEENILKDDLIKKCFFKDKNNITPNVRRYPDLMVHEFETLDHQILAVEIKRVFNKELILRDVAKLVVYCNGKLNYKKGILILINSEREKLLEIPEIRILLKEYPEIEIWIVKRSKNIDIDVICSKNI